ncbi:MAG: NAD-dependent DNA ligase [Cyanobacteria bacterium P01_H01_bin.74]
MYQEHEAHEFNKNKVSRKIYQNLLGICQGLMADNVLNESEFYFLRQWLLENEEQLTQWPGTTLMDKIKEILDDGIVEQSELDEMRDLLSQIIGGTLQETGTASGNSTDLPINAEANIIIPDNTFCFTGIFRAGARKTCETLTRNAGGYPSKNVVKALDYLVIGVLPTVSWINTSYGTKIVKAVEFQKKSKSDLKPLIVTEDMWEAALKTPAQKK